jgi:hypothetical protein
LFKKIKNQRKAMGWYTTSHADDGRRKHAENERETNIYFFLNLK